jgi:hypothetical protein
MSTATVKAAEIRSVHVEGTCGHRWVIRTRLTNAEIERGGNGSYTAKCAECREMHHPCNRRVRVVDAGRCQRCKRKLASINQSDTCGPCEVEIQRKIHAAMPGLEDELAAERTRVLAALPGQLPEVVLRSGVRWVRVSQVLAAAIRRGEVVTSPGRDPLYSLVAVLKMEQEDAVVD